MAKKGFMDWLDEADNMMDVLDSALPGERPGEERREEPKLERVIDLASLRRNLLALNTRLQGNELKEYKLIISEVYAGLFAAKGLPSGG